MNTHRFRGSGRGAQPARFRPAVLGLDQRIMLTSAAAGAVTPAQVAQPSAVGAVAGQDLPLSVKRVPGFLSTKYNDLATPYDNPSIAGLRIDDKTVNYWKITSTRATRYPDLIPLSLPSEELSQRTSQSGLGPGQGECCPGAGNRVGDAIHLRRIGRGHLHSRHLDIEPRALCLPSRSPAATALRRQRIAPRLHGRVQHLSR